VRRWSIDSATRALELIGSFIGHEHTVDFAVEKDNNRLVTAARNMKLKEWNFETFECLNTVDVDSMAIWSLAISKDKSRLVCGLRERFELRRGSDLSQIATIDIPEAECSCELVDGSFVSGSRTGLARWSEAEGVIQTYDAGHHYYEIIELNSDVIVTLATYNFLKMWSVSLGKCLRDLSHYSISMTGQLIKLSKDKFVSWINTDRNLRVWNEHGDCIDTIPAEGDVTALARVGDSIVTSDSTGYMKSLISVRRLK